MRIKRLELYGFKSFADRTVFNFETGVTALVGPNGCGKSNVVDAIKWVLGEQSAKSLRGDAMLDVIFNGTSSRKPLGYAEVTIAFDNSSGRLPVDYDEVAVTRRLYRSGDSEYFINKQLCRLRDVKELFMDTGLGTKTYSVIEQGRVDALLQANPKERRMVFEEAAGISKYKVRKLAAIRKVERVEQNLQVLASIIEEVDKNLRSVARQASKARRYLEISEELKGKRVVLALADYARHLGDLERVQRELSSVGDRERTLTADAAELQAFLTDSQAADDDISTQLAAADARRLEAQARIERLEAELAYAAKRSQELDKEAESLEAEGAGETARAAELEAALAGVRREAEALASEEAERLARVESSRAACAEKLASVRSSEEALEDLKSRTVELLRRRSSIENEISAAESEMRGLDARVGRIDTRGAELRSRIESVDRARSTAEAEAARAEEAEKALSSEHDSVRTRRDEAELRSAELDERMNAIRSELESARSRLAVLEDLESRLEGVSPAARALIERSRGSVASGGRSGLVGMLADLVSVEAKHERAIEAALGRLAEALVVEKSADALEGIEHLRSGSLGDASFLPLDSLRPAAVAVAAAQGMLGPASSFVACDDRVRPAAEAVLGGTWVVETLDAARAAVEGGAAAAVTLAGETVERSGLIRAGSGAGAAMGLLSRKGEISRLRFATASLEGELSRAASDRHELSAEVQRSRARIEELAVEMRRAASAAADLRRAAASAADDSSRVSEELQVSELERSQASRELDGVRAKVELLRGQSAAVAVEEQSVAEAQAAAGLRVQSERTGYEEAQRALAEMQVSAAEARARQERFAESAARSEQELAECRGRASSRVEQAERSRGRKAELDATSTRSREELAAQIAGRDEAESAAGQLKARREELRSGLAEARTKERELASVIENVRAEASNLRVQESEVRLRLEGLIERARSDYKVDLAEEYSKAAEAGSAMSPELTEEVSKLQAQLERMGPVNVYAVEEEKQLKERSEFLHAQHTDLVEAREALRTAIARINKKSRALFAETFTQVAENFQAMFRKLFGGGKAEVRLEEGVDVLEAGIDIMAKPPGKELRSITLLSGGEKALSTIALLFSIFKCKPSPFCILDEVDAPLDEANVDRFNLIVQEFMGTTQFIIITHNKLSMTYADSIYGVTMQEAGVSKRISVRLEDMGEEKMQVA